MHQRILRAKMIWIRNPLFILADPDASKVHDCQVRIGNERRNKRDMSNMVQPLQSTLPPSLKY